MGEYYFHLDQLTVGYNGKPLIDQIQVGIHKGEIVTLIGPNGSGKSTILKSITRQLKILGGKVLYEENDLHKLSYKELSTRMAVVLTERMRPELMTCHDIVATGRYPYTLEYRSLSHAVMMWDHLLYYEAYVLYSISDPTQIFPQDEHQHIAVHFLFDRILT